MPLALPDRSTSKRDRRRAELCRTVMTAAEQHLADGGSMGDLSVERLVALAGISRSSFYVYFEDRSDLLQTWFAAVVGELVAATDAWWRLGADATRDDLRAVFAGIVTTYRPHARLMAATYDAATHDPGLERLTSAFIAGSASDLRKHIKKGQREGWIAPGLLPAETAEQLTWMAERTFHQVLPRRGDAAVERLVDAYTDIVWKTLYVAG